LVGVQVGEGTKRRDVSSRYREKEQMKKWRMKVEKREIEERKSLEERNEPEIESQKDWWRELSVIGGGGGSNEAISGC
jgi:chromatin segregation and condensation protein Rec8/ScpA/Scc1 (kleisin family)